MNSSSKFLILLAVFLAALIAVLAWRGFRGAPQTAAENELAMRVVSVRETTPLYRLSVEYPQFDPVRFPALNTAIAEAVEYRLDGFIMGAAEAREAWLATLPAEISPEEDSMYNTSSFYLNISWEPVQLNTRQVSFVLRFNSYEGGANERQDLRTWNYDLQEKKEISLADVYTPSGGSLLEELSAAVRERLIQHLSSVSDGNLPLQMIEAGTQPVPENFRNFTFTDTVLRFYFPKYQVAPGSFGEQRVILPRE